MWKTPPGRVCLCLIFMCLGPATSLQPQAADAATLDVTLRYETDHLSLDAREGYVDIRLPGSVSLPRAGAPALPVVAEQIVLPAGMKATRVLATSVTSERIACGTIRPFQPPAILGPVGVEMTPPTAVAPDPSIYEGARTYPSELAVFRGTGRLGDIAIAACEIHPVQYDPITREIVLHTEIALTIELTHDPDAPSGAPSTREMTRVATEMARARMHGAESLTSVWQPGHAERLDIDDYQYVIITSLDQMTAWEPLAEWKTAKGVPATVVSLDYITQSYTGRDQAEQIRNFIIDAVDTWGTSYVLLAGDEHIIPSRVSWAFDCEAGIHDDENDLYADLYFSDLDGTWDANGNDIFGEVDDEVDLYPDILVGRAPTDDASHAGAMVSKFLAYEKTPPSDFTMEAYFFAEILWSNPFTDSGVGKDMIADEHFGTAYDPIEPHYETLGNLSPSLVFTYLNWGPHLTNHGGHASYRVMSVGDGYFERSDADALTNGPRNFVLFSIGCWSAAFDKDCIAEHFATNANGGTIAFIGNSRYGWGSPGNPGWGYSETFDRDFYGAILSEGFTQFGAALAWPKILRIPFSQTENVYRWHEYQVNLLGDPEMSCHTAEIMSMTLDAPAAIPIGASQFTATVTDGSRPIAGARLCLSGSETYMVGFSDGGGQVTFATDLPSADLLTLTASAPNHTYDEMTIAAAGNDPFLTVDAHTVDDDEIPPSAGNGNGEIGAGEVVEVFVTLHNYGGSASTGVEGTLTESCDYASIVQGEADFGTIASGGDATNSTPFVIDVQADCPADETIVLTLAIEDDDQNSWNGCLPLTVLDPGPRVDHYSIEEIIGDGDGIVDPGETIALTVHVINSGSGTASDITATLSTTDPNLDVLEPFAAATGDLPPGEVVALTPPFELLVEESCPETTYGSLDIAMAHSEGVDADAFLLAVGEPGFSDDMESGEGGWTHSGMGDLWHLTDYRSHSGTTSWYCGTLNHEYENNIDAALESPLFVAPENALLSFWLYFDVTIYGVDGIYVDSWDGSDWRTHAFLGSGGALDELLFTCDWTLYTFDLDHLVPGSTAQVRFRFESDEVDVAEGFYLDDVRISSPVTTGVELPLGPADGSVFTLAPLSANPVDRHAAWALSLAEPAGVIGKIYDARGRLVRDLVSTQLQAGEHVLRWDGTTSIGVRAPDGVYFLSLRAADRNATLKLVLMGR